MFTVAGSPALTSVYVCLKHWWPFKSAAGLWLSYVEVDLEDDRADGIVKLRKPRSHWQASPEQVASKKAKRRLATADDGHPIYGSSLVDERLTLFDYSNGDFAASRDELIAAADALYLRLQEWLASRRARPLDLEELAAYELDVSWLGHVFVSARKRGKAEAKRHELALSPQPLTVCAGSVVTRSDPELGTFSVSIPGCGRVIPDTLHGHGGGTMHRSWCDDCAPVRHPRRARTALDARRFLLLGRIG